MRTVLVQLPPGLDISKAKDLKNGSFQIGKHTYDLTPSRAQVEVALLTKKDDKYIPSEAPAQLMELTRSVTLPKIDKSVVKPREMIPQRQNLKARHFASGYGASASEASASEASEASTSAKRSNPSDSAPPETPVKKQKKEKKDKTPKSEKKSKKSKSEKKKKD